MIVLQLLLVLPLFTRCADDDGGTEADRKGVGAECSKNEDCLQEVDCETAPCVTQICLTGFKGGYCGVVGCTKNSECPGGSACVAYDDGKNYCFRQCADKAECNRNRSVTNESNCSSNQTFVEASTSGKACVPPSGG